jgi:hypothetical protein
MREAEAIEEMIGLATSGGDVWVGSVVLEAEPAHRERFRGCWSDSGRHELEARFGSVTAG